MTNFLLGALAGVLGTLLSLKGKDWAADKIDELKDRFTEW